MPVLDIKKICSDDALDFFRSDNRILVRFKCGEFLRTQPLISELGFSNNVETTGSNFCHLAFLLAGDHPSQCGENSLALTTKEGRVVLQVQTQSYLARQRRALK